tara:strand:- start:141 stop:839 length:699 start_codon:yes stop_codon:yes gene_type:complete
MATINASKWSRILITNQTTHAGARDASTGTSVVNNSVNLSTTLLQYRKAPGRRIATTYNITRAFYYFDTSGITTTVNNASVKIAGSSTGNVGSPQVILIKSTAFSGDGSTNAVVGEFGNVTFNTSYSNAVTSWSTSAINTLNLKSQARTDIENNDYFICAVIEYEHDFSDSEPSTNKTSAAGVNYNTVAYLEHDAAPTGPANVGQFNVIAASNIDQINPIRYANIAKINTID